MLSSDSSGSGCPNLCLGRSYTVSIFFSLDSVDVKLLIGFLSFKCEVALYK